MANLEINQLPSLVGNPPDTALFIVQNGAGTFQVTGAQLRAAYGGGGGGGGGIAAIQPGSGIAVDETDPANPIVSALLEAGTNVTIVPGSLPNSLRINSTGGGGGGGGGNVVPILASAPVTLTAADLATPYWIACLGALSVDLPTDAPDGAHVVISALSGAVTINCTGGQIAFSPDTSHQGANTVVMPSSWVTHLYKITFSGSTLWYYGNYSPAPAGAPHADVITFETTLDAEGWNGNFMYFAGASPIIMRVFANGSLPIGQTFHAACRLGATGLMQINFDDFYQTPDGSGTGLFTVAPGKGYTFCQMASGVWCAT